MIIAFNQDAFIEDLENKDASDISIAERRKAFGVRLGALRQDHGITDISLSQATRISLPFINALEMGEFDKLPGYVFGRGFVRNICKVLQVNEDEFMDEFAVCWEGDRPLEDIVNPKPRPDFMTAFKAFLASRPQTISIPNPISKLKTLSLMDRATMGALATAVVLIGGVFLAIEFLPQQKPVVAELPPPALPATKAATPEVVSQPQHAKAAAVNAKPPVVKTDTISMNIIEPVKIRIKIDGGRNETKQLSPDLYEYQFKESARLLIYDAGSVELSLNGKSLGSLGKKGRVRRISFAAGSPTSVAP